MRASDAHAGSRVVPEGRPELVATLHGTDVHLADEWQLIWDLQDLSGANRLEAAGLLREWLLRNP